MSGCCLIPLTIKPLVCLSTSLKHTDVPFVLLFPVDPKPGPVGACQEPGVQTKDPEAKPLRSGGDLLRVRGTSREATTRLGNDAAPSRSSWAEIRSPPKCTTWPRFARPAISLMHSEGVHHTLDSAMAHLAQGVLERLCQDESSSGFRDACGTVSQSLGRHRHYHLKTEQSRSTPALQRHFSGLTALSGNGPLPASQASSTSVVFKEQRHTSALSCFCLAFSYGINKPMLTTKKVAVPQF